MGLKDKDKQSAYCKKYYAENREKILQRHVQYRHEYKEILCARRKQHYHENKDKPDGKYKKAQAARFGLTVDEHGEIMRRGCEICGAKAGTLCIDHNHTTNKVRGCLCAQCNSAIGLLKEDTRLLFSAIGYLKLHKVFNARV